MRSNWKPSPKLIQDAMKKQAVKDGLMEHAEKVRQRAESIAASEGVTIDAELKSGERPKGRPYVDVISHNPLQEWGSRWVERRRIMGRAAEEFR